MKTLKSMVLKARPHLVCHLPTDRPSKYLDRTGPHSSLVSSSRDFCVDSFLASTRSFYATSLNFQRFNNFVSLSKTSIHPDTSRPITILPIQPQSFSFSPHHHQNGTSSLPGGQLRAAFIFPCLSSQLLTFS